MSTRTNQLDRPLKKIDALKNDQHAGEFALSSQS